MSELSKIMLSMAWENKKFYVEYLAQSHYYTFHSTRMLAMAAGYCGKNQQEYYRRSIQHIKEESGHDHVALVDLKNLGESIDNHPEYETTQTLWELQFYKIPKCPSSLLGYILALEDMAVSCFPQIYKRVSAAFGENGSKFIKIHAEDDPDHVQKALAQIQSLPDFEQEQVWRNHAQTVTLFISMLNDIKSLKQYPRQEVARAV